MKILLVTSHFPSKTGGIGGVMESIVEFSDHHVDVLSYSGEDDEKDHDAEIIQKDFSGYLGLLKMFYYLSRYSGKYDVIYFDKPDDAWTALMAKLQGKSVFAHSHGSETYIDIVRLRSYLRKLLFGLSVKTVDKFIAVSNFTKERLKLHGAQGSGVEVVHNGVDFERFNSGQELEKENFGIPEDAFLITTVSRLHKRKGHDLVIDAIKDLEDVYYLIVGTGNQRENLKSKAENLGISDRVTFTGYVESSELPNYYTTGDIFAMPSKHMEYEGGTEGFPLVFLEANAAGLPVIGSEAGGSLDAIKDGETGFLADTDPEDIRDKIVKLKEDDELRSEMEDNAVEWAREHDWPRVIKKIDDILDV